MLAVKKKEFKRQPPHVLEMARTHNDQGDPAAAEPLVRSILLGEPEHIDALFELARSHQLRNHLVEAEILLDHALEIAPDHFRTRVLLVQILTYFKRHEALLSVAREGMKHYPETPEFVEAHATACVLSGSLGEACGSLTTLLATTDAMDKKIYYLVQRAKSYRLCALYEQARSDLDQAETAIEDSGQKANYAMIVNEIGLERLHLLSLEGQSDLAKRDHFIQEIEAAIKENPARAFLHLYAQTCLAQGQWKEGFDLLSRSYRNQQIINVPAPAQYAVMIVKKLSLSQLKPDSRHLSGKRLLVIPEDTTTGLLKCLKLCRFMIEQGVKLTLNLVHPGHQAWRPFFAAENIDIQGKEPESRAFDLYAFFCDVAAYCAGQMPDLTAALNNMSPPLLQNQSLDNRDQLTRQAERIFAETGQRNTEKPLVVVALDQRMITPPHLGVFRALLKTGCQILMISDQPDWSDLLSSPSEDDVGDDQDVLRLDRPLQVQEWEAVLQQAKALVATDTCALALATQMAFKDRQPLHTIALVGPEMNWHCCAPIWDAPSTLLTLRFSPDWSLDQSWKQLMEEAIQSLAPLEGWPLPAPPKSSKETALKEASNPADGRALPEDF